MAGSFLKKNHKYITIFLCVLSIALILTSQFIPWFTLDADKSIGGLADINLKADFYQTRVDFTATAHVETGGLGGLIGGIGDLGGGLGSDGNITISENVYYWEGIERLQGVVGVLYDTTKNADYLVNPQTWNSTNTRVYVNTHTDLIPFWPAGIGQEITVTVRLNQSDNIKSIRINEVSIDIYADWNETQRKYSQKIKEPWKITPGDFLYEEGDEKVYKHAIAIDKDWGDRIGIIAMVDLTMTDNFDQEQYIIVEPFTQDSHPQEIINVIPISQGQFASLIMMFAALPMTLFAAIFSIIGIFLTHFETKRRTHILFTASLLQIFAVIFFVNGANTLLNMIDFLKPEDYTWSVIGILIPLLAGIVLLIAFIIEFIYRPKEGKEAVGAPEDEIKFDISDALAEEAEGFECPECGEAFSEMVSKCPACGAEFEGADEEEGEHEGFECPACGTEFSEMVSECPNCGAEFDDDEEGEEEDIEEEEEEPKDNHEKEVKNGK